MADENIDKLNTLETEANIFTFVALASLFFMWGFITVLNDLLIPAFKASFDLTYTQASLVQFCFFGAYFIVSPLADLVVKKMGYQMGIVAGLLTTAGGALLFFPAASANQYVLFLGALAVLAGGITILQVAANPYVAALGSEETAAVRLTAVQTCNSLGVTVAPLLLAGLIIGSVADVQTPYLMMAGVLVAAAIFFRTTTLPTLSDLEGDVDQDQNLWTSLPVHLGFSVLIILAMVADQLFVASMLVLIAFASRLYAMRQHRSMIFGALAIFLYVGGEVSIGSWLVNYFAEEAIGGLDETVAGQMLGLYWGAAFIGRIVGSIAMNFVEAKKYLAGSALLAVFMILISVNSSGELAMYSIISVGFFNSIMFPTIFTMAVKGLGPLTSTGSGLVCQGIVGGALVTVLQAAAADSIGIQASFLVPMLCYIYIGWYALSGSQDSMDDETEPGAI